MEAKDGEGKAAQGPARYRTFDDETPATGLLEKPDFQNGYTVGEAVESMGFGRFQMLMAFMVGFAWLADGMEIMVLSILGPTLVCDWLLPTWQEALITTVVFTGYLIGAPCFGLFADHKGRKMSLLFSSLWALYYGVLSAFSPTLVWLLILRLLTGVGIGGAPQAITYYAEFLPNSVRGRMIILIEVFWAIGGLVEVLLAMVILENFDWRWWLISSAAPLVIFALFCLWIPESARFLMASGRTKEAQAVLEKAARVNGAQLPPGPLVPEEKVPRGQIKDLFTPGLRKTSILLSFIWFACAFSYYGIILLSTELIKRGTTCTGGISESLDEPECVAGCARLTNQDYLDLLWTSAAELPGLLMTAVLVDPLGRKLTMLVEFLFFGIVCFVLFICMSRIPMIVILFCGRAVIASAFQVAYLYTPEVYPTQVRALSVGVGSGFGRFGAIVTPYIAEVLLGVDSMVALSVYGVVSILAALATFCLPIETKGKSLNSSSGH